MQVWGSSARASLPWEAIPKSLEECNEKVLNAIEIVRHIKSTHQNINYKDILAGGILSHECDLIEDAMNMYIGILNIYYQRRHPWQRQRDRETLQYTILTQSLEQLRTMSESDQPTNMHGLLQEYKEMFHELQRNGVVLFSLFFGINSLDACDLWIRESRRGFPDDPWAYLTVVFSIACNKLRLRNIFRNQWLTESWMNNFERLNTFSTRAREIYHQIRQRSLETVLPTWRGEFRQMLREEDMHRLEFLQTLDNTAMAEIQNSGPLFDEFQNIARHLLDGPNRFNNVNDVPNTWRLVMNYIKECQDYFTNEAPELANVFRDALVFNRYFLHSINHFVSIVNENRSEFYNIFLSI